MGFSRFPKDLEIIEMFIDSNQKESEIGQLRKNSDKVEMTSELVQEYIKCSTDIFYFIETYYQCNRINQEDGSQDFGHVKLFEFQKRMIKAMTDSWFDPTKPRNTVSAAARGSGKTEVTIMCILWYILFNKEKKCGILADKGDNAKAILGKLKSSYCYLPKFLQQVPVTWAQTKIELNNGCVVESFTTTPNAGRSKSLSVILVDECSAISSNIWDPFYAAIYPTLTRFKDSKMIIFSTPLGLNHFHTLFKNAVNGKNGFKPMMVDWREYPGRDEQWKKETIRSLNGGVKQFAQEYECKFLGSSSTLINSEALVKLDAKEPIEETKDGILRIWKKPEPGKKYIIGADIGTGTQSDSSVAHVIEIKPNKKSEQVAMMRCNWLPPEKFAEELKALSIMYNEAYMIIENNESGCGNIVLDRLWYHEKYGQILNFEKKGLGIRATSATKLNACCNLRSHIEFNFCKVRDQITIDELKQFEEVGKNVFKAASGKHDDCVTALYWALYYFISPYFRDYSAEELSVQEVQEKYFKRENQSTVQKQFFELDEFDSINTGSAWLFGNDRPGFTS